MMRFALWTILVGLAGSVLADEPRRDDFAYEALIELKEPGSVYRAPLIVEVYKGLTREDLGDLRVYNAAGEVVAHGLTRPSAEPGKALIDLPVFAVPISGDGASGDVSLFVATGERGSIIALKTGTPTAGERSEYLVDASQSEDPLAALEISWAEAMPADRFLRTLLVDASDDLKTWRSVTQGAVASLHRDDQVLEQRRIEVPSQRVKYLRLRWADPKTSLSITGVRAEFRPKAVLERDWLRLQRGVTGDPGEHRFDVQGLMPVDRARVPLPTNSVARVAVLSRQKAGDPWVLRGQKTVFALQTTEGEIKDDEIPLRPGVHHSQWLLRFERGANGLGSSPPELELGWTPHELVFVARGPAPFNVTYGQARAAAAGDYGINELLERSKRDNGERVEIRAAAIGTPSSLRGEVARTVAWYAPWRQWLLWAVLLVSVGVLAALAVRISRQIGRPSE